MESMLGIAQIICPDPCGHSDCTCVNSDIMRLLLVWQCHQMKENERTTLFVDFQHVQHHDVELADAVKEHFHDLEPYLRMSVSRVMSSLHEGYAQDRDFHVSFFNLSTLCPIRQLRTDKIATLVR